MRTRKQLYRQDVRVAVHDAPGECRARLGDGARSLAHPRHESAQQHRIGGEPGDDRQRQMPVHRGQQRHAAGAIDQDVPDGVGTGDHAVTQRRPRLDDAIGDASREIVLEECPALAYHMPVVLPADHVGHAGIDDLIGDEELREERRRPHQQEYQRHHQQFRSRLGEQPRGTVSGDQRYDTADEHRDGHIECRDRQAGHKQGADQPSDLAQVMPVETCKPPGRRFRRCPRGRVKALLDPAKHLQRLPAGLAERDVRDCIKAQA